MSHFVSSGARLDRLPMSRFHWKILGLISAGACLDAFDVYLAGGVSAAMLKTGVSPTSRRTCNWKTCRRPCASAPST